MLAPNFSSMRALIFDLDGTLIDSKQDLIRSVNAMLVEMGREALHQDTISGYIGHGAPKLVAPARLIPSKLGRRATYCARLPPWQSAQFRVSLRRSRARVSQLFRLSVSTVRAMTGDPARSARLTSASATSHWLVG